MIKFKMVCKINSVTEEVERITVEDFLATIPRGPSIQVDALSSMIRGSAFYHAGYRYIIKELVQKKIEETKKFYSSSNN